MLLVLRPTGVIATVSWLLSELHAMSIDVPSRVQSLERRILRVQRPWAYALATSNKAPSRQTSHNTLFYSQFTPESGCNPDWRCLSQHGAI